jgi:hypothetical protein
VPRWLRGITVFKVFKFQGSYLHCFLLLYTVVVFNRERLRKIVRREEKQKWDDRHWTQKVFWAQIFAFLPRFTFRNLDEFLNFLPNFDFNIPCLNFVLYCSEKM